ncbi:MAG: hypothetical protein DMG35_13200 [Acidobacteria bacterium]|nr:MAG: hypothetical protein AUH86_08960 [Acidobacteria bacterium 13_1_40CM_4_58_4]PYT59888.1 MAG: hypothetical protein DMG35_13200 [Acidobacteriota bacterium]
MKDSSRPLSARGSSVQQDWRAWLPEEKAQIFHQHEHHLQSLYCMFSVSLNEAIELKHIGLLARSLEAIAMASELCERLTRSLAATLRVLHEHAKHYGTVPNAAPMNPGNYQGQTSQRSARMSGLLNRVLLSHRLQFLHKVSTLEEMVEDLGRAFRSAAGDLADGLSTDPQRTWNEVDVDHYDLNTCLREAIVLFKSFLVVLPVAQLGAFERTVGEQLKAPADSLAVRRPVIRHRRMAAIAGE